MTKQLSIEIILSALLTIHQPQIPVLASAGQESKVYQLLNHKSE